MKILSFLSQQAAGNSTRQISHCPSIDSNPRNLRIFSSRLGANLWIEEAGLLSSDYINFKCTDVSQKLKGIAKKKAERDEKEPELTEILNDNSFYRTKILESLFIDSMLSIHFEAPFVIDYNVGPTLQWKCNR